MRRSIIAAILLIQFCVQFIPLAIADEDIVLFSDGGSGSIVVPAAESGSSLPVPASESGAVRTTSSGAVMVSSGAVVGTGAVAASVPPAVSQPVSASFFPVRVVVSEVMWMGSDLSTADEWVEIAGFGSGADILPRSVSGWTLLAVKAGVETPIAKLPDVALGSGAAFAIANAHASASRLLDEPSLVTTAMSLPNTQLLLRLKDASGAVVDEVDDGVGVPMAGANPSGGGAKASMERVDPWKRGSAVSAWKTATLSLGFDDGPPIFGTPGRLGLVPSASSSAPTSTGSFVASSSASSSSVPVGVPVLPVQAPPAVRLTEIMANPPGVDADEWIEIGSFESEAVDLAEFSVRTGTAKHPLSGALSPGMYRRIGKLESGLPLPNSSGTVELLWRDKVIDAWTYAETAEGISLGRTSEGVVTPQCVPSPEGPNTGAPLDPSIRIQESSAGGGRASFNLEAAASAGSLAGAACSWVYPDGYANGSCNPPSHSMVGPVYGDVILTLRDYCGNTVVRTMRMEIAGKPTKDDDAFACVPGAFTGVVVSELLPNPTGHDDAAEWIEIQNLTPEERSLCGWSVADEAGDPYRLDRLRLPGGELLLLPRPETGIALNNDRDAVYLYSPQASGGSGAYQIVRYVSAPEGRSYARRNDGVSLWSTPTPEAPNVFDAVLRPVSVEARIVQVMPNPRGADTDGGEWIELRNETAYPLPLTGWRLRVGNDEASLDGVILSPKETKRIASPIALGNVDAFVRLVDRDGLAVSTFAWASAAEGRSISRPRSDAYVSELSLIASDDCVSWSAETHGHVRLDVRISGISVPDISKCIFFISALSKENKFEYEMYSYLSGSTLLIQGTDVASLLLREGMALVDHSGTSPFLDAYALDEREAREGRRGIWAQEESEALIDENRSVDAQRAVLARDGLLIHIDPAPGVIEPGASVMLSSNVPSTIEVATGTGAFRGYAGPIVVERDSVLRIRAVANVQSSTGSTYFYNSFQPFYMMKNRYPTLLVSEVYPSPKEGESEWIELWNPTNEQMSLAGWSIDDLEDAGSRPDRLPFDAVLEPGERRAFSGSTVAWNNMGDEVRLIDPKGRVSHALSYGPVKKGMSYAASFFATGRVRGGCMTAESTPGARNECVNSPLPIRSKKNSTKAASKPSIRVRYRNVVPYVETMPAVRPLFSTLFDVRNGHVAVPSAMLLPLVFCFLAGLLSIPLFRRLPAS